MSERAIQTETKAQMGKPDDTEKAIERCKRLHFHAEQAFIGDGGGDLDFQALFSAELRKTKAILTAWESSSAAPDSPQIPSRKLARETRIEKHTGSAHEGWDEAVRPGRQKSEFIRRRIRFVASVLRCLVREFQFGGRQPR
jgi:hypothetical protein